MAIKAMDSVTVVDYTDVSNFRTWYKTVFRTSSAPTVAANATEAQVRSDDWDTTEPGINTTKKLYTVNECIFGDGTYVWSEVSLSSSYEAAIQAYNKAQSVETTVDNIEIGGRNLFRGTPTESDPTAYEAYDIDVTVMPEVGDTFIIQFWDVDISHSGKTASTLGLNVYWGGSSVSLTSWTGTNYFTNGHADYLTASFTITPQQKNHADAANQWFRLCNSSPSAPGTMSMTIGKWKLERGTIATDWTIAPEDSDFTDYIEDLNADISDIESRTQANENSITDITTTLEDVGGHLGTLDEYTSSALEQIGIAADDIDNINDYLENHIRIDEGGLTLYGDGNKGWARLNQNGVEIYGPGSDVPIATYGENAIIGDSEKFHISISPTRISFYNGPNNEVAYVDGDKLYISQSVVLQRMDVGTPVVNGVGGQWTWKVHENANGKNNLYLKWLG